MEQVVEPEFYAVVLAGGLSSRMGCDKRFLRIEGEILIDRAVRLAVAAIGGNLECVFICGEVPGRTCIPDSRLGMGPIGGIATAVQRVVFDHRTISPWILVMPVDMPLMTADLLEHLVLEARSNQGNEVAAINYQNFEMPFVFRVDNESRATIAAVCEEVDSKLRSIRTLLERLPSRQISFEERNKPNMLNANSKSDWERVMGDRPR